MATAALETTDTRTRLIDVAVALFTRHSFAGTSLQMIADELGFTKAAIYHHFRTREQLLAANHSMEEMARKLEVDSLGFLSVEGLYWAMDAGARNPSQPQFTDHYFTGDYPTRLMDRELAEGRNEVAEKQLSLLVSA